MDQRQTRTENQIRTEDKFGPKSNSDQRQIQTKDKFRPKTNSEQRQIRTENQIRIKKKSGAKTRFVAVTKSDQN